MRKFLGLAAVGLLITGPAAWAQSEQAGGNAAASDGAAPQQAMSDAAVVQAHVDAYRTGDINAFLATFAKDAIVEGLGITANGHAEIRKLYALNFAPGGPKLKIVESGMSGPNVYLINGHVFGDGRELCCGYSEFTIENGKIIYVAVNMVG